MSANGPYPPQGQPFQPGQAPAAPGAAPFVPGQTYPGAPQPQGMVPAPQAPLVPGQQHQPQTQPQVPQGPPMFAPTQPIVATTAVRPDVSPVAFENISSFRSQQLTPTQPAPAPAPQAAPQAAQGGLAATSQPMPPQSAPVAGHADPYGAPGQPMPGLAAAGQPAGAPQLGQPVSGQAMPGQGQPPGQPMPPMPQPGMGARPGSSGPPPIPQPAPVPGVRWTWSMYPNAPRPKGEHPQRVEHAPPPAPAMVVPLACMYTPLHSDAPVPRIGGTEVPTCRQCSAVWNCHCRVDVAAKYWACPSCLGRNPLPASFAPDHPALAHPTVEYAVGPASGAAPAYVFVIDTAVEQPQLDALRSQLLRALEWLPPNSLVGLVTYGAGITVWELGFDDLTKCYALRGQRAYSKVELLAMLGIGAGAAQASPGAASATGLEGRFLVPLEAAEFTLSAVLEELAQDHVAVPAKERAPRCTGGALNVAVTMMELLGPRAFGKVMLFAGGPCTRGPGAVVGPQKEDMIRSQRDLIEGNAPIFQAAVDFYGGLEQRLVDCRCALDVVAQSLDQTGLLELRACIDNTGGSLILGDCFDDDMFSESFQRYFQRADLRLRGPQSDGVPVGSGFALDVRVFTSGDTRVAGCLGLCSSKYSKGDKDAVAAAQKEARFLSDTKIGVSGTTQWLMSSADAASTLTVVFDTDTEAASPKGSPGQPLQAPGGAVAQRFVQFVTTYTAPDGERRVRVSSIQMPVAPTTDASLFAAAGAFDQGCAAAVMSRLAVWLLERRDGQFPLEGTRRWLDRILVRFVRKFASYTQGDPNSLRLAGCFSLFPTFIFNLRRSEYFMVLNISPDETAFKRHFLMREPCDNCLLMIQPTVDCYTIEDTARRPVPLDASSVQPDRVLLMDAFFHIHIYLGKTLHEWQKAGYAENPEFAHFKALLDAPEADAAEVLRHRQPYPRFTRTDKHRSQDRQIMTRLNPSVTHNTAGAGQQGGQGGEKHLIYTDDASIARFMQTLKQAAVAPEA